MATIEKLNVKDGTSRFRARIRRAGLPETSGTFRTKREASEWAVKTEADLMRTRYRLDATADQIPMTDLINRYLRTVLPKKSRSKRYLEQQKAQLHWWRTRLTKYRVSHVTSAVIAGLRDELAVDRDNATVNRYLAALSHVFTKAVKEWEILEASPLTKLGKLKESRGRARFLTEAERTALLAAAARLQSRKPLLTIIVMAITTAARKSELLGLQWRDVDFERGMITARETKNGDARALHISGYALQLLRAHYAQRHPRSPYIFAARCGTKPVDIEREFAACLRNANIRDFHFHDLRHTAASYMAMYGAQAADIKAVLGHRSLAMTDRYTHLMNTHVGGVMESITAKVFPKEQAANG